MGFFRRLFGRKKPNLNSSDFPSDQKNKSKKWSFLKSSDSGQARRNTIPSNSNAFDSQPYTETMDMNKHAIAVATATAAVAEAALATAHAAAEVVRLANEGSISATRSFVGGGTFCGVGKSERLAAVKIQAFFRGYLARRALRALKALVKLQALVRGNIVRKQTADMLKRMQTLVRVQARARANRSRSSESFHFLNCSSIPRLPRSGSNSSSREIMNVKKSQTGSNFSRYFPEKDVSFSKIRTEDEISDKILEVDTWKPHKNSQKVARSINQTIFDSPSKHVLKKPLNFTIRKEESTADDSPQVLSSSRPGSSCRGGTFTPTASERSWGLFSDYSGHPNYMSNTESSRAKARSHSAPRQRLEFENFDASLQRSWDGWSNNINDCFGHESNSFSRVGSAKLRWT